MYGPVMKGGHGPTKISGAIVKLMYSPSDGHKARDACRTFLRHDMQCLRSKRSHDIILFIP